MWSQILMRTFKRIQSFLGQLLGYNTEPEPETLEMWRHFCTTKEKIMLVSCGEKCAWCGAEEKTENIYLGLFYAYPIQKYMRWPEYMEYHYWQDKKSS